MGDVFALLTSSGGYTTAVNHSRQYQLVSQSPSMADPFRRHIQQVE